MARLRTLAVAVASNKVAHVFLMGDKLIDWGLSAKASKSTELVTSHVRRLLKEYEPHLIVTEDIPKSSGKAKKARTNTAALNTLAENAGCLDVKIRRQNFYDNKYEEAAALVSQFPDLQAWLPNKPRIWEGEPRNMMIFEALSLALTAIDKHQS